MVENLFTKIFVTLVLTTFLSCQSNKQKAENKENKETKDLLTKAEASRMTDSIMKTIGREDYEKAKLLGPICPVKIKSTKIYSGEYSTYKNISITYTNTSVKAIDAIKFVIYGENNWGEPAKINYIGSAYNNCESQIKINPGRTITQSWQLQTDDPTKAKSYVTKIHFLDGEVWDIDKQ